MGEGLREVQRIQRKIAALEGQVVPSRGSGQSFGGGEGDGSSVGEGGSICEPESLGR